MSQFPSHELPPDAWMVAVAPGDIRTLNVDQLDEAYQAGHISDQMMVWTHGMTAWAPLGEVLGGGEAEAPESAQAEIQMQAPAHIAPPVQFAPVQAQQPVQAPAAFQSTLVTGGRPVAPVQAAGFGFPAQNAAPGSVPFASAPFASAPLASAPSLSTAPVALNLDSLMDVSEEYPKKKSKGVIWAMAAIVAGGAVFAAVGGANPTAVGGPAAAAQAPVVAEGDKPLVADKAVEGAKDPNAPLAPKGGYNVTEAEMKAMAKEEAASKEMREKMADALTTKDAAAKDKPEKPAKGSKAAGKAAAANMKAKFAGGGSAKSSKKGAAGHKGGGNSYDPLNPDI